MCAETVAWDGLGQGIGGELGLGARNELRPGGLSAAGQPPAPGVRPRGGAVARCGDETVQTDVHLAKLRRRAHSGLEPWQAARRSCRGCQLRRQLRLLVLRPDAKRPFAITERTRLGQHDRTPSSRAVGRRVPLNPNSPSEHRGDHHHRRKERSCNATHMRVQKSASRAPDSAYYARHRAWRVIEQEIKTIKQP